MSKEVVILARARAHMDQLKAWAVEHRNQLETVATAGVFCCPACTHLFRQTALAYTIQDTYIRLAEREKEEP